ncbi:hypothetical protein DFH11DRAFT_1685427 [Phellopilus nigrolimitatus]|nr:hypothetical protein DFH11DRAFT_1685427 [Phellopilus nigrolimitatus]
MQTNGGENNGERIDHVWTTSRTARQIYALGEVEKTDPSDSTLPQGEERSEQFVLEVSEYFERLDQIHINIRSTLAHIRKSRIAPSAINAPPPNFVPQPAGVGTPSLAPASDHDRDNENAFLGSSGEDQKRGLQEERVNRDAWRGILDALTRLKAAQEQERASQMETDA